jgi:single-strand DNA-binding protein
MASVNKVIIVGHLGRDPELRFTQGGMAVAKLAVATSRKWTNKETQQTQEETEWHRVTVWGKSAEACDKYLAKGSQVYVEGRLRTSSYEQDGVKKYATEIVSDTVQFLGGRGDGGSGQQQQAPQQRSQQQQRPSQQQQQAPAYAPPGPDEDDDIPF